MTLTILPKCDSYANRSPLLSPISTYLHRVFRRTTQVGKRGKTPLRYEKRRALKFRTNIKLTLKDRKDLRLVLKNSNVYLYFMLYLRFHVVHILEMGCRTPLNKKKCIRSKNLVWTSRQSATSFCVQLGIYLILINYCRTVTVHLGESCRLGTAVIRKVAVWALKIFKK